MSDVVICAEGLGKKYVIGHQHATGRNTTLRDAIARGARGLVRSAADMVRGRPLIAGDTLEEFWALKDVSFEIGRGEVVGIIGRNGAGKSTLLKILSRITEPSAGRVTIKGRVASLLEVGTGFHPELTGRENVYLNGAILGMNRAEIHARFDEIVAFAEIEKFLDTPVKRYSSGMYVRLAFAVAAHLEPEILLVDEVLAVGDAEFQRKCLGKMSEVAGGGRTVLFVSHNLGAVGSLCNRAILLTEGKLLVDGPTANALSHHLSEESPARVYTRKPGVPPITPHLRRAEVVTSRQNGAHEFGLPLDVVFNIRHATPISHPCFSFQIVNQYAQPVIHAFSTYMDFQFANAPGESVLTCHFPSLRLNVGRFYLRTYLTEPPGGDRYEYLDGICSFDVVRSDKTVLWGWRPEVCAYHEELSWSAHVNTYPDGPEPPQLP